MRYCGNCGKPLDEAAIQSGVCPACGKPLAPSGPVPVPPSRAPNDNSLVWGAEVADRWGPTVPPEARLSPDEGLEILAARPTDTARLRTVTAAPTESSPNPITVVGLGIGLGIAVLMVLACTISFGSVIFGGAQSPPVLAVHRTPTSTPVPSNGGLGFATQSPDPTPLPYTYPTPTLEPTQTPFGGPPTSTPVVPPTQPSGGQATLQVSQPTCDSKGNAASFVVSAVGNGELAWQATSQQQVTIQPQGGIVDQNRPNQVIVTFGQVVHAIVQVTVSAQPGNQQQTVTINCLPTGQ
jgi:hypothetical protein